MKTFLIQTVSGEIKHDFAFHLLEAVSYHEWYFSEKQYEIILSDEIETQDAIPVGSLEYVFSYIEKFHLISRKDVKPINVPLVLREPVFLKRDYVEQDISEIRINEPCFIKSVNRYKAFADIIDDISQIPDGRYIVSEVINIESEWRAFIFNGELVGLQNYAGDFTRFPHVETIKAMIQAYHNAPVAYTLDVGINDKGTFVIEVHPFVSCGLYGFQNYKLLPVMFVAGFKSILGEVG